MPPLARFMLRACSLLLLALFCVGDASAQLRLLPGSTLQIDGQSSVNTFTCTAEADTHGRLTLDGPETRARGSLAVPVAAFNCGNGRINSDFRHAMRAKEHPDIRFVLDDTILTPAADATNGTYELQVTGRLTIAGLERPVRLSVKARRASGGIYEAYGAQALRMTDFGIDPPTALFGLIKTRNDIVVRFHFIATGGFLLARH